MAHKNWHKPLTRLTKNKDPNKQNKKSKRRNHNSNCRNTKKPKENYYDQYYEPRRKGQLFRNIQPTKKQEETDNQTNSQKHIESIILKRNQKTLPINKTSRPDGFTGEFYKTYKRTS